MFRVIFFRTFLLSKRVWLLLALCLGTFFSARAEAKEAFVAEDEVLQLAPLPPSVTSGGTALAMKVLVPLETVRTAKYPTVFYLQNLAASKKGTESDESLLRSFLKQGCLVVTVDFKHSPTSKVPGLNRDLGWLRDELHAGRLLPTLPIDKARVYFVPEGCRLLRNQVYYRDTREQRELALDLIYPSLSLSSFGAVLEFSCDNKDRMGNYSLSACSDTLLDGFATEGFAVVMADHPVKAPYKGLDPMPDCIWKTKAAVRALRHFLAPLGHNGRLVPIGFSRGSGMALLLATTSGQTEAERSGEILEGDESVQAAVVLSGRFTYVDLLPNDHMIPRYVKAWGPRAENLDTWRKQGALDLLKGSSLPPLFLSINCTESPDALYQMTLLRTKLATLGADSVFMMDRVPRGHKVPLVPAILEAMNRFLHSHLEPEKE